MADCNGKFVKVYKGAVGKLKRKEASDAAIGDRHRLLN